ncbi:hypothetical protein [Brevundimonas sp. UBA7664]|nr:hypothetical protein [Brevundimonas sp. UBA7664]
MFDLRHHDGRQGGDPGPVHLQPPAAAPIDERTVDLAIRRLRARLGTSAP